MNQKTRRIKLTKERKSHIDIIEFLGKKKKYSCMHIGNSTIFGYSKVDEKEYMESNMNTFDVKFFEDKKTKQKIVITQGNCIW